MQTVDDLIAQAREALSTQENTVITFVQERDNAQKQLDYWLGIKALEEGTSEEPAPNNP